MLLAKPHATIPFRILTVTPLACVIVALVIASSAFAFQQPPASPSGDDPKAAQTERAPSPQVPPDKPASIDGQPKAYLKEPIKDFGTTWAGIDLTHTFKITNTGDAPLNIIKIKPTCGCTIMGQYPATIEPGKTGEFPFKLKTEKLKKYAKHIRIMTNDPITPMVQFQLTGLCRNYIELNPDRAFFSKVFGDKTRNKTIKITCNVEEDLVLELAPAKGICRFECRLEETKPGREYELHVAVEPPFTPGFARDTVILETNIPQQPVIKVKMAASFLSRFEVRPPEILVPTIDEESTRVVFFSNNDENNPIEVTGVTIDDDKLDKRLSWRPVKPGGQKFEIRLTIPAGYSPPVEGRTLSITTNDVDKPEIKVPIFPLTGRQ